MGLAEATVDGRVNRRKGLKPLLWCQFLKPKGQIVPLYLIGVFDGLCEPSRSRSRIGIKARIIWL